MSKYTIFIIFAVLTSLFIPGSVLADEFVISGNGSDSTNVVAVTNTGTVNVEQNNSASVINTVASDANTGNNTASSNAGGDTEVKTGEISSSTSVTNSVNSSSVSSACCINQNQNTISVSGNGADSNNTVTANVSAQTNTIIHQDARITNVISGIANTGGNTANDNTGGVISIHTGSISVMDTVRNGPINSSSVITGGGSSTAFVITISGNGADSINSAVADIIKNDTVTVFSSATILNSTNWSLSSGNNEANGNIGNVDIQTGDIVFDTLLQNGPINSSAVTTGCDCSENHPQIPPGGVMPPTTTVQSPQAGGGSGGGSGGASSSNGEALGAAVGNILPATGSWLLYLMLGNVIMLFMGAYLRLRSGRSPALAFSF